MQLYGQYDPNKTFWKEFTAIQYLPEIKGALEIHHAVDDDVVKREIVCRFDAEMRGLEAQLQEHRGRLERAEKERAEVRGESVFSERVGS